MFGIGRKKQSVRPRRSGPPPLLARSGRFALVVFAVSVSFCAVGARLYWLHVVDAPRLRAFADEKRRSFQRLSAQRGRILDSRGGVFATSREVWDVIVDPGSFNPEQEARLGEIAESVAKLTGKSRLQVLDIFQRRFRDESTSGDDKPALEPSADEAGPAAADASPDGDRDAADEKNRRQIRWAKLAEGVDLKTRDAVAALRVRAVRCDRRFEREYPRGRLASHLIGYVNKIGLPAMGIEKAFDFYLKGEDGWIDSRQNKKGQEMADRRIREISPSDGQSVELTLDAHIQQAAEQELDRIATEYAPLSATVIVSEAKSGRLLALANWPSFDLNEYNDRTKAPMESQRNRAVTDIYEPGSVFKIVSYSAALQEGLLTPDTMIDCSLGAAPYRGKVLSLPEDAHHLGRVDLRHAVWQSSNRGAAQIGMKVAEVKGEQRFWKYMSDFGFGSACGLVTGTEVPGILHKPEKWDGITITRLPMGHSVSVTPLQMHFGMSVIAAGGDLYAPMLVSRIVGSTTRGADGREVQEVVREFEPVVRQRGVISRTTSMTVADMLRGVCGKEGTAKLAAIPGYDVAGKTGTTQKIIGGKYSSSHHVASFAGFFPASDPRIVITVVVDEPHGKGTGYGGVYSAPAFRNIAEKCIKWLEIPPSNRAEYEEAQAKELKKSGQTSAPPARAQRGLVLDPF